MRLLELFAGTGSVGKAFERRGWEVTSLDVDPKANASITADILTWDYRQFPPGHFDAIWASPVCTMYSIARTTAKTPRDLVWADSLVEKTLEIIDYFKPAFWAFENPASGMLKRRPCVAHLPPPVIASYCRYGYGYRKNTALWTNSPWAPLRCCKDSPCEHQATTGRHPMTAQRGPGRVRGELKEGDRCSLRQLYSMPPGLCDKIAEAAEVACGVDQALSFWKE